MSIKLNRYTGNEIEPKDDVRIFQKIFTKDGVINGCAISQTASNQVRITSGTVIANGADYEIIQEDVVVSLATVGTMQGRFYVRINLTDLVTPIKFMSVAATTLPTLTQTPNFYETNGIWEQELATYTATTSAISNLVQTIPFLTNILDDVNEFINSTFLREDVVIYISATGNDTTGDGTSGAPYLTFAKALSMIPKNLNGYNAKIIPSGNYGSEAILIEDFFNGILTISISNSNPVNLYVGNMYVKNTKKLILKSEGGVKPFVFTAAYGSKLKIEDSEIEFDKTTTSFNSENTTDGYIIEAINSIAIFGTIYSNHAVLNTMLKIKKSSKVYFTNLLTAMMHGYNIIGASEGSEVFGDSVVESNRIFIRFDTTGGSIISIATEVILMELTNGWVNYGIPYSAGNFFKDSNGLVHLNGVVKSGTVSTSICTLPIEYRPSITAICVAWQNTVAVKLTISPDGTIVSSGTSNALLSLDGVSFSTRY